MVNKREYGIVFIKDIDCGIAKITVFDTTESVYVGEDGTKDVNPLYRYVDLYQSANHSTLEQAYTYWISLEVGHSYVITAVNSGTHNPLAIATYNVGIIKFLQTEPLVVDDIIEKQFQTFHTSFESDKYTYDPISGVTTDAMKTQVFNGDDVTRTFVLSGTNHAVEFVTFSIDGGITWRYPSDLYITWGSNAPAYDNETIDSNGQFGIYFIDDAPPTGSSNVIIKFRPLANKAQLTINVKQPHDEFNTFKDYRSHVVMQDYAVEFIP